MAKLRITDGYTRIHHELIERVFCRVNFPSYEIRLIFAIIRMSWGWNQRGCYTSHRELSEITGIDLRHIHRSLKSLINKFIIEVRNAKDKTYIEINRDITTWRLPEAQNLFSPDASTGDTTGDTPTPVEATPPTPVEAIAPYISASGPRKKLKETDLKKGEIEAERNDLLFEMRSFRRSLEQKA